jgi:hypothetical protein
MNVRWILQLNIFYFAIIAKKTLVTCSDCAEIKIMKDLLFQLENIVISLYGT